MSNSKVKCKVDNRWYWGLENACLTITSPAGGHVRIDKWHMSNDMPKELNELVWRIVEQDKQIALTIEEMKLLTTYPKASVYKKYKKVKA